MMRFAHNTLFWSTIVLITTTVSGQNQKPPTISLEKFASIANQRARQNQKKTGQALKKHFKDLHLEWSANRDYLEKVITLLAGQGPDTAPLFVPYLDPGSNQSKDRNLSRNVRRILEQTGIGNQAQEIIKVIKTGTPLGRQNGIILLGSKYNKIRVEVIRKSLADKAEIVAATACQALARMGASETREDILKLLDRNSQVLTMAVLTTLMQFGSARDLDQVIPTTIANGREETLLLLFKLMQKTGKNHKVSMNLLLDILEKKKRDWPLSIQLAATQTLGKVAPQKDRPTINALKNILHNPKTWDQLRKEVAFTLHNLGDKSGHTLLLADARSFLRHNSKVPYAFIRRADIYFKLALFKKAADDYRRAITLCKSKGGIVPSTWIDLFRCLARMEQYHTLVRELKRSNLPGHQLKNAASKHPELKKACEQEKRVRRLMQGT